MKKSSKKVENKKKERGKADIPIKNVLDILCPSANPKTLSNVEYAKISTRQFSCFYVKIRNVGKHLPSPMSKAEVPAERHCGRHYFIQSGIHARAVLCCARAEIQNKARVDTLRAGMKNTSHCAVLSECGRML